MHLIDSSSAPFPVAGLKEARPPLNKVSKLSDEHITFSTVKRKGKPRHTGVKLWILKISNMFEILSGEGNKQNTVKTGKVKDQSEENILKKGKAVEAKVVKKDEVVETSEAETNKDDDDNVIQVLD